MPKRQTNTDREIEEELEALGRTLAKSAKAFNDGYEQEMNPRQYGFGDLFGIVFWIGVGLTAWHFWPDISRYFRWS